MLIRDLNQGNIWKCGRQQTSAQSTYKIIIRLPIQSFVKFALPLIVRSNWIASNHPLKKVRARGCRHTKSTAIHLRSSYMPLYLQLYNKCNLVCLEL